MERRAGIPSQKLFVNLIRRVIVDEAHHISSAGRGHAGKKAHRPCYGRFHELRMKLTKGTPFSLLSATINAPHILNFITASAKISDDALHLSFPLNRTNIAYASLTLPGDLKGSLSSLDRVIPVPFPLDGLQTRTMIFADSKPLIGNIWVYLTNRLPSDKRKDGIIREYHSSLSMECLDDAYESFNSPDRLCSVLICSQAASNVCDIFIATA